MIYLSTKFVARKDISPRNISSYLEIRRKNQQMLQRFIGFHVDKDRSILEVDIIKKLSVPKLGKYCDSWNFYCGPSHITE